MILAALIVGTVGLMATISILAAVFISVYRNEKQKLEQVSLVTVESLRFTDKIIIVLQSEISKPSPSL